MVDNSNNDSKLASIIEAILFTSPTVVTITSLSQYLGVPRKAIMAAIEELDRVLNNRGIRLLEHENTYQLTTAPEVALEIQSFFELEITSKLSQAALESLSIIAYKQPVTRPQMDSIRGVNCDGVIRTLLSKGLIQENGRAPSPGRPILYGTSPDFLRHFGLTSLNDLPVIDLNDAEISNGKTSPRVLKT